MSERGGASRGGGEMAGGLARRRGARPGGGGEVSLAAVLAASSRRRARERVGKSKDPAYKLGSAYVLESVHDEVMAELVRPEVRALLIRQFGRFGVRHAPKKVAYSDLVELLLRRWLENLEGQLEAEGGRR